ncbi:MAG TPA: FAD:protein FMN transferase [Steroidobacteraceae bacterium]|nr:FAD:protein FMN transferase [Steroidobacteraceae bacterium]
MASPCEVLIEAESEQAAHAALDAVAACAWRIEDKYSRYRDDNIVHTINSSAGRAVEVDDETANLLDFAAELHRLSGGRFDVTSGVLRRVWRFDGGCHVPDDGAVRALLPLVGWSKVSWHRPALRMREGMQIDFGGICKEYAVDQAAAFAGRVLDGSCLVNFGGDLAVTRPRRDGACWSVGIEAAAGGGRVAASLIELRRGALATSGDAHRFVLKDGKRYAHVLDPLTGWPVEGAPRSVTVAADSCTQAGMLSTLAILRGPDAERFLRAERVPFWIQR